GIADPVIKILDRLLISPEKLDPLGITAPRIIIDIIVIIKRDRLDKILVFFIIGFYPEDPVLRHLLIIDNIMGGLGKPDIGGIEQLAVLGLLIEYAIGQGHLRIRCG